MREGESKIETNDREIENLLGQISNRTATREDKIPARVLKHLKGMDIEWLTELFNDIIKGNQSLPIDRTDGRV